MSMPVSSPASSAYSDFEPHHTFHIPVMGIGFTLDTPIRVAPYGIDSVISLVDDVLIETVRKHYCELANEPYEAIDGEDARARRITAYLDLVADRVEVRTQRIRASDVDDPRGIRRYFSLLPTEHPLRAMWQVSRRTADRAQREQLESQLRAAVRPGLIDVNIMTKLDRAVDVRGEARPRGQSDAAAALRGFAASRVVGRVILSAGFNPRICALLGELEAFAPGPQRKGVVLKVSDFRSAKVQATYLAKRGVWVDEFRIESGLNCGGHAFPSANALLGPVLSTFAERREALRRDLGAAYVAALRGRGYDDEIAVPEQAVTAQGGVGTADEHRLLHEIYGVDSVGWASPFLLVPEVCRIDDETLFGLAGATGQGVALTRASPLGVRFWQLQSCGSERARRDRMSRDRPGSACPKGFVALGTDAKGRPECPASRSYQRSRLIALGEDTSVDDATRAREIERITSPTCICHDLGGSLTRSLGIEDRSTPCVCPGPNIVHFDRVMTLDEMVDHIYGRGDVLTARSRPHVLCAEISLYIAFLREQWALARHGAADLDAKAWAAMKAGLRDGIAAYRELAERAPDKLPATFGEQLDAVAEELAGLDHLADDDALPVALCAVDASAAGLASDDRPRARSVAVGSSPVGYA